MEQTILQFFENLRCPALTAFFGVFSALGEAAVFLCIILFLYWLAPKKVGEQALMAALTGAFLTAYMKSATPRPRPYLSDGIQKLDPPLGGALDDYDSFPSGHTLVSAALFGTLALRTRKVLLMLLFFLLPLLVAAARLYFGVHYFSDVVVGLILGWLFAILWALVFRVCYRGRHLFLLGFAALSLYPLFFDSSAQVIQTAGLLIGAALAFAALHFTATNCISPFPHRLWRIPVALSLLFAVYALTLFFPSTLGFALFKWGLLSFTAICGTQLLFEQLKI